MQALRETYQCHKEKAVSYKVIAVSESFELVLLKAKDYMDYNAMDSRNEHKAESLIIASLKPSISTR